MCLQRTLSSFIVFQLYKLLGTVACPLLILRHSCVSHAATTNNPRHNLDRRWVNPFLLPDSCVQNRGSRPRLWLCLLKFLLCGLRFIWTFSRLHNCLLFFRLLLQLFLHSLKLLDICLVDNFDNTFFLLNLGQLLNNFVFEVIVLTVFHPTIFPL